MPRNDRVVVEADLELFGQPLTLTGDSDRIYTVAVHHPPTLAEIIEYLAGYVVPGFRLRLPAPWDGFVAYRPPELTLTISGDHLTFAIDDLGLSVVDGFLDVTSLGFRYDLERATLDLELGVTVLGEVLPPVNWDPIAEPVPPVETDERLFELHYLGLGQRKSFAPTGDPAHEHDPETMDAVIERLSADDPGLAYDSSAGWLFATRLSAARTLDLDLVLWDPNLFGFMVHLRGEQAGSFAGLRFEILYRRINAELGVFHTDLELPTVMRRLELGAASVTLSAITVDIYTDGSFMVDLGFPHNLDFSRSFHVEIFPFVGAGGFYVGLLPAGAVPQLPQPAAGRFDPVLAVGIGLSVGVGKTIEMGALSAGATVTLNAVFEGVVAAYHADPGETGDVDGEGEGGELALYYRAAATAALIGRIHGSVDFGVISAQVEILAVASATLVLEAHRATVVRLEARVSVDVHIKILFVRLDFSFSAMVRAEFVIGSATAAPWDLPAAGGPMLSGSMAAAARTAPAGPAVEPMYALTAPGRLGDSKVDLSLWFVPQVTLAGLDGTAPSVAVVAMLAVDMTADDSGESDFGHVVDRCFRWAAEIVRKPRTRTGDAQILNRDQLEALQHQLGRLYERTSGGSRAGTRLSPDAVLEFWDANFRYELREWSGGTGVDGTFTIFPMKPVYRLDVQDDDGATVHEADFSTRKPCPPDYLAWLEAWSERHRLVVESEERSGPDRLTGAGRGQDPSPVLAGVVLVDYFRIIMRTVIGDALHALERLPHRPDPGTTLGDLSRRFGAEPVMAMELIPTGEEPSGDLVAVTLEVPRGATVALPGGADPITAIATWCGPDVDPQQVLAANLEQPGLFTAGATVEVAWPPPGDEAEPPDGERADPLTVTVLQNDTARSLIERLLAQPRAQLHPPDGRAPLDLFPIVLAANPDLLRAGARVALPPGSVHHVREGKSLASIADHLDIEPDRLLAANAEVEIGGILHLPGCEEVPVGDLVAALAHLGTTAKTGSLVTRYFLHGLAVPDPDEPDGRDDLDNQDLVPLYRLTGQQFPVDRDRIVGPQDWNGWRFKLGTDAGLHSLTPADTTPQTETAAGFLSLLGSTDDADAAAVNNRLADTIAAVTQDRPYVVTPIVHPLARPVDWLRPPDPAGTTRFSVLGLPDPVRQLVDHPTRLRVDAHRPTGRQRIDVRWATRIDVVTRRLPDPDDAGERLSGLYTMLATDHRNQTDLLAAMDALTGDEELLIAYADPAGGLRSDPVDRAATRLLVTNLSTERRPPDAGVMMAAGDEPPPSETVIPMTDTGRFLNALWRGSVVNQDGLLLDYHLDGDGDASGIDAALDAPDGAVLSFIVLWPAPPEGDVEGDVEGDRVPGVIEPHHNAAVVVTPAEAEADGGDHPHYEISAATVPSLAATVTETAAAVGLTITDFVAANATTAGLVPPEIADDLLGVALRHDLPLDEWDQAAAADLAGLALSAGAELNVEPRWLRRQPLVPRDAVSIRVDRPRPDPDEVEHPGSMTHLESIYNLVGYEVVENDWFRGSNAGLPLGPSTAGSDDDVEAAGTAVTPLVYRRMIRLADLAAAPPEAGPYAAIGGSVDIDVSLIDLYGNRTAALKRLTVPLRYRDELIGPERWPGVVVDYRLGFRGRPGSEQAALVVAFDVDIGRALPGRVGDPEEQSARLRRDVATLTTVVEQLADDRIGASLWCSMNGSHARRIEPSRLAAAARRALAWTRAAAELTPLTADRRSGEPTDLARWADRYDTTVEAIGRANRHNPRLLRPGARVRVTGRDEPHRVVGGETLQSIADAWGLTPANLVAENARQPILAASARVVIPDRYSPAERSVDPTGGGDGDEPVRHVVASGDRLGRVAERYSIPLARLVEANRDLVGCLQPGSLVRSSDGPYRYRVADHDTLSTLAKRVAREEGRDIDPIEFVEANPPVRQRGLRLRTGAVLLIPPRPVEIDVALGRADVTDLVPLEVTLDVERPAALVDRHFRTEPAVWRSSSTIRPALGANAERADEVGITAPATEPGVDPLEPLARTFARAFPGWRLGRESVPVVGSFRRDALIAVRDLPFDVDQRPEFHRPPPLLTGPWSGSVTLLRYEDGELHPDEVETVIEAADVECWNLTVLGAVESVLAPTVVRRLAAVDPAAVSQLLALKHRLAGAVSVRTAPILASTRQDDADRTAGLAASREVVRQRLLRRLDDLSRPGCVVDLPTRRKALDSSEADPSVFGPAGHTRLFGAARTVANPTRLQAPVIQAGELSCDRTGGVPARLTTHLTISPPAGSPTSAEVELEWQPVSLEYDIHPEEGQEDNADLYHRSRWVTFVIPPEPVPLGRLAVPIIDRRLPDPPVIVSDRLVIADHDGDPVGIRRYDYAIDHRDPDQPRDRIEGRLVVNDDPLAEPAAAGDEAIDELARCLCRFVHASDELHGPLTGPDHDAAAAALTAFVALTTAVADAWDGLGVDELPPGLMATGEAPLHPSAPEVEPADPPALRFGAAGDPGTATIETAAAGRRLTVAAVAGPLDGLNAHRVTGELTMVRNTGLVAGHDTDARFVLRSSPAAPVIRRRFAVEFADGIDVSLLRGGERAPASLEDRLYLMIRTLTGMGLDTVGGFEPEPGSSPRPLEIELQAWIEAGPPATALRTPIGMLARRPLDLDVTDLAAELGTRLRAHRPPDPIPGRWVLAVRLFSGLATENGDGDVARPLIDYGRLVIETDHVH